MYERLAFSLHREPFEINKTIDNIIGEKSRHLIYKPKHPILNTNDNRPRVHSFVKTLYEIMIGLNKEHLKNEQYKFIQQYNPNSIWKPFFMNKRTASILNDDILLTMKLMVFFLKVNNKGGRDTYHVNKNWVRNAFNQPYRFN
jgi:hypothetical protein